MLDRPDWVAYAPTYLNTRWALATVALASAWLINWMMAGLTAEMWSWVS
jgi:hypothetical protein